MSQANVEQLRAALELLRRQGPEAILDDVDPDLTTREPIVLMVVAALATVSAAGSVLPNRSALLGVATGLSLYLLGCVFAVGPRSYHLFGSGFWVATAATVAMSIGGVLALSGEGFASRFARPS